MPWKKVIIRKNVIRCNYCTIQHFQQSMSKRLFLVGNIPEKHEKIVTLIFSSRPMIFKSEKTLTKSDYENTKNQV